MRLVARRCVQSRHLDVVRANETVYAVSARRPAMI